MSLFLYSYTTLLPVMRRQGLFPTFCAMPMNVYALQCTRASEVKSFLYPEVKSEGISSTGETPSSPSQVSADESNTIASFLPEVPQFVPAGSASAPVTTVPQASHAPGMFQRGGMMVPIFLPPSAQHPQVSTAKFTHTKILFRFIPKQFSIHP